MELFDRNIAHSTTVLPAKEIIHVAVSLKHRVQLLFCQSIRMRSTILAKYSIEL
jgi:hypothetical protein